MTDAKMKIKKIPFDIPIPNLDDNGIAETIRIEVEAYVDPETGEETLTPESLELVDRTQARHMGLLSADEIKVLRERLKLTQNEMSQFLQIGAKSYTRWESGRARPSRSMNVLLCALRDGQLSVNYLRQLRDPNCPRVWFDADPLRSVFISVGDLRPTEEAGFRQALSESYSAWKGACSDLWAGSNVALVCRFTNEAPNAPWLIAECKEEETQELKGSSRRNLTPPPPSWNQKKIKWRSRFQVPEVEENVSS